MFISSSINLKFLLNIYTHNTLIEFENQISVLIIFREKLTFLPALRSKSRSSSCLKRLSFRPSETIQRERSSVFISSPINVKFLWKLYNHNTLNEFENQISVLIIFGEKLTFLKLKSQILRIVNANTLACSFLHRSI